MPYIPGQLAEQRKQAASATSGTYIPGTLNSSSTSQNYPVSNLEELQQTAARFGVKVKEKKPSIFQSAIDIISRPNYASAGAAKAIVKNLDQDPFNNESILGEAWKGLSGQEKETYSDVLGEAGVKNKVAKGVIGFALDIALDPLTYFGGTLVKGVGKGLSPIAKGGVDIARRVNPRFVEGVEIAGKSLKDALGNAFSITYDKTEGLPNAVFKTLNKLGIAKEDIIERNTKLFSGYSKKELQEAGQLMIDNRRLELQARKGAKVNYLKSADTKVNEAAELMKAKAKELAKLAGLDPEKAYENYIPFLRTDKLGTGSAGQQGFLKIGKQGYQKEFKNLVPDEKLLKKPIEAYTRREVEIVRDNFVRQAMNDLIWAYGKPRSMFKSVEAAAEAGYKPVYKKGSPLRYYKETLTPGEDIIKQLNYQMTAQTVSQPQVLEQAFLKVGKAIELAEQAGLKVGKGVGSGGKNVAGRARLGAVGQPDSIKELARKSSKLGGGGADVGLKAYTSEVITHELGHSFDTKISGVINTNPTFQKELANLVNFTQLGGSQEYRARAVERFAEFIMTYIHNPKQAKKLAPTFTKLYETSIAKTEKIGELTNKLKKFYKLVDEVPNIRQQLYGLNEGNVLEKAIRNAFPKKEFIAVAKEKPIGYLKENDFKFINDFLYPEMKTIDLLAKGVGYDGFTRWFKQAVTSWFPAFHIRNYISGNVQNYSVIGAEAFNPKNHNTALGIMKNLFGKGTDDIIELGGKKYSTKALAKELKENFQGSSRYISDIGDYIEEIGNKQFRIKKIKDPGRKVGNFIEMNQKAVAMVGALRQGKTLPEAIKLAEIAGFDYSKITKFESKIMRRLIPFYTFARKNAELQIRTAVKNPERILNQIKFARTLGDIFGGGKPTEEDLKGLPDWALNGLGFKVEGNRFLTEFGLPLEEFVERVNKPFKTTTSSLNPLVKYPIESQLGYDFFREQDLIDINKISPVSGELIMSDKSPDWLKKVMNVRKVETQYGTKYYAQPKALHLLRNIPTARIQNTLEKLFEGDRKTVDKWLAFLTGARIYDIDTELQKYFRERDLYRDLQDELLNKGIAVPFEKANVEGFYVPKNK